MKTLLPFLFLLSFACGCGQEKENDYEKKYFELMRQHDKQKDAEKELLFKKVAIVMEKRAWKTPENNGVILIGMGVLLADSAIAKEVELIPDSLVK